jgi:hypothetical protein
MRKIGELFKCNPLACLSVFLVIMGIFFGQLQADVAQIRRDITGIYVIMIGGNPKVASLSPEIRDIVKNSPPEYSKR